MRADRERSRTEMRDLQQQLSDMHDELDQAKKTEVINTHKEVLLKVNESRCKRYGSQIRNSCKASSYFAVLDFFCQEMAQLRMDFQEMLHMKEEQEEILQCQKDELSSLKEALKEEVETHDKYTAALKEEYEQEIEKLFRDLDLAKEVKGHCNTSKMFLISN